MTLIGTRSHPLVNGGKELPLYSCDGFINTQAGWNMKALKLDAEYFEARSIWESLDDAGKAEFERQILQTLEEHKKIAPTAGTAESEK